MLDAGASDAGGGGPSFAADVHPILLRRCGMCHRMGGAGFASAYVLTDDPGTDHATVLDFLDGDDAEVSRLLVKARGEMHGGGAAMPRTSQDYATVRAWIAAGAVP